MQIKTIRYIALLLFVNIFIISQPSLSIELNKTDEIQIRISTLDKSITIFTFLNRKVVQLLEDIDMLEEKEIEKIINQYTILIDFLEKEISTDPLNNLYQENFDKFIQSLKKFSQERAKREPKRWDMTSMLTYSIGYVQNNDAMRQVYYRDVSVSVENNYEKWPNNSKAEVIALLSFDVKLYEDALKGFENVCNCNVRRIVISKSTESAITRRIERKNPDLLLAIGIDALSKIKNIKNIKDIPIIYLMILNPQSVLSGEENITGVSMNIPPEKQLDIFKKALPDIKKIGLLFDPNNSDFFVRRAQYEAKKMGIELIIGKVDSSKKVPSLLIGMKEEIDALWMIPDITVFSPETIEFSFIFAFESKIPVFTFSEKFLEMGALISLSIDPFDLGKQGGELAGKILSSKRVRNLPGIEARKVKISINSKMAKLLGIEINNDIFNKL